MVDAAAATAGDGEWNSQLRVWNFTCAKGKRGGGWHVRAKAGSLVALFSLLRRSLSLSLFVLLLLRLPSLCVVAMELLRPTRCVKIGHMVSNFFPFPLP